MPIFINQNRPLPRKGRYISTNLDKFIAAVAKAGDLDKAIYDAQERGDMRSNGDWEEPFISLDNNWRYGAYFEGGLPEDDLGNASFDLKKHVTYYTIDGKKCPVLKFMMGADCALPVGMIAYCDPKGTIRVYNPRCGNLNTNTGYAISPDWSPEWEMLEKAGIDPEQEWEEYDLEFDAQKMDQDCIARLIPVEE